MTPGHGPWAPLPLDEAVACFAGLAGRWWVAGGLALELATGRSWRGHGDTDVGIVRSQAPLVRDLLAGWDVVVAAGGALRPWRGEPLDEGENNLWCRPGPGAPWRLDVTVGAGDDDGWAYRRDPSLRLPWDEAVRRTGDGVPYLAPHLQLLFKSKAPRPKDHRDAAEVIPELDAAEARLLAGWLGAGHPWQALLAGRAG